MCQRTEKTHPLFSDDCRLPSCINPFLREEKSPDGHPHSIFEAWLASRMLPRRKIGLLAPGAHRPFNRTNIKLAYYLAKECALDLFVLLWRLHPIRTTLMICLNILRGVFPAFRGYSQALIINELQSLIMSGHFTWSRLLRLTATELVRRILETALESSAEFNENVVHDSARLFVEYQQMEQRVKLDIPTISDPVVRDLLQESDHFVRSFNSVGGFGFLSPFDLMNIFALISELLSHLWVLFSVTGGATHFGVLFLAVFSTALPVLLSRLGVGQVYTEMPYNRQEARTAQQQEKLRNLAYSDTHRPEVILFGLGPWILRSWSSARKAMISAEQRQYPKHPGQILPLLSQVNFSDFLFALQNVPLVLILQSSSASLGSLALYRSSIQMLVVIVGQLLTTMRMALQSVFLMSAFCAAMKIKPRLQPKKEDLVQYQSLPNGAKIEIRNLSFTYPGCKEPSLRNINLNLMAGETLAVVGYNGSGKSTLAKIILRIFDFDSGELIVNGVDIRRYDPSEYHRHITTVLQGFSKFNSTVKENVGVGQVSKMGSQTVIQKAIHLAGATSIVDSLPNGLRTKLDSAGFDPVDYPSYADYSDRSYMAHGLSGGEWQRIAISRAFMRADQADIDLLVFDEPTSSLDAHAQRNIFDTIDRITRSPSGERTKTVIFITHRLSTARRADKVAMMENGTITEFGTHEQLLHQRGSYASLYSASM